MNNYNINKNTIAIIPIDNNITKIIEEDNTIIVNDSPMNIIKRSCKYYGSTYSGRHDGTKYLIGIYYKLPIIVEETNNIICFPTSSTRDKKCIWLFFNHINDYIKYDNNILITFKNMYKLKIDISFYSFDNQYYKAIKLFNKF